MARYTVTFSCGHTEEISLSGPIKERERKIAYYQGSGLCSECRKMHKDVQMADAYDRVEMLYSEYKNKYANCETVRDSYNSKTKTIIVYVPKAVKKEASEPQEAESNLPELIGTERQIELAKQIRAALLAVTKALALDAHTEVIETQTSAAWFIDKHGETLNNMNHPKAVGCEFKRRRYCGVMYKSEQRGVLEVEFAKIIQVSPDNLALLAQILREKYGAGEVIEICKCANIYRGSVKITTSRLTIWKKDEKTE